MVTTVLQLSKVEDVLVTMNGLTFLADFYILDTPSNLFSPIVLGRPFMMTASMVINVKEGRVNLETDRDRFWINVYDLTPVGHISLYAVTLSFPSSSRRMNTDTRGAIVINSDSVKDDISQFYFE